MPLQLVNNEPEFVDEKRVVAVNHFHILTTRVALRLVAGGGGCVSAEETRAEQMVGIRSEGRYHADDDDRDREVRATHKLLNCTLMRGRGVRIGGSQHP